MSQVPPGSALRMASDLFSDLGHRGLTPFSFSLLTHGISLY